MVGDLLRVAGRPIWCPMNAPTLAPTLAPWPFDNSYARLPDRFHARLDPTPVAAPRLVKLNVALSSRFRDILRDRRTRIFVLARNHRVVAGAFSRAHACSASSASRLTSTAR